jgi:hypothetical protein
MQGSIDQQFVNAVREVLGLSPLYGETGAGSYETEERRWAKVMLRQGEHWVASKEAGMQRRHPGAE